MIHGICTRCGHGREFFDAGTCWAWLRDHLCRRWRR